MYVPGDRAKCGNCGRWRHEHYDRGNIWTADRFADNPCFEYFGVEPTGEDLVSVLEEELKGAKERLSAAKRSS